MKFNEIKFDGGEYLSRAVVPFENGYKASIVIGPYTYGGKKGLFEIAILDDKGEVTYNTPITNDVIGHLTEQGVEEVLQQISELPKKVEDKNITEGYYEEGYFAE